MKEAWRLDLPAETGPEEARELEALAGHLQAACPDPPLPPDFLARLRAAREAPVWSLRDAFRRNAVLRLAAGLLVLLTGAVPVVAAVVLLQGPGGERGPVIRWEPPAPRPGVEAEPPEAAPEVVPEVPDLEEILGPGPAAREAWLRSLEVSNRLARAAARWRQEHGGLRSLDLEAPDLDWSRAAPEALARELERRLESGDTRPVPAELLQRVEELWRAAAEGSETRRLLRGWMELLEG